MIARKAKLNSVAKNAEQSLEEKRHLDELLDEGLKESFPASDPLAILEPVHGSQHKKPREERPSPNAQARRK